MKLKRFLYRFGGAIAVVSTWIGILYLAKDVKELPEALQEWRALVPFDRETLLIWFSGILVLWILWRDVRPYALPRIMNWFGWSTKAELITALDNMVLEGVRHRNRIRSDEPVELTTERGSFRDWNEQVLRKLSVLSLKERSYFRTLDLFEGQCRKRLVPDPERSHMEMIWNEKLKRLREIIGRIEE